MRIARAAGVVAEVVGGKAVLLRPDDLELVTLNATGSAVWDALATPRRPSELVDHVLARHPGADRAVVAGDVERFLSTLRRHGLVVDAAG